MNKHLIILLGTIAAIVCGSCEEPLVYQFQERPQIISCEGADKALLHEALYSFQEDIAHFYNEEKQPMNNNLYIHGYNRFVQPGLAGDAEYALIASDHTKNVMNHLKEIEGLWDGTGKDSKLNYSHPYISCILDSIQDLDLRKTFENMRNVNYMSPKVLAIPLRSEVTNIVSDPHLAMYIALDGFYQNLMNEEAFKNE